MSKFWSNLCKDSHGQRPVISTCLIYITILSITFYLFSSLRADFPDLWTKNSRQPLLRLNAQNEFHISIFSDLHYGEEENGWGIDQDIKSTRVMSTILDHESPDLVIINGDLITGENTFLHNSTKYVDKIVQPMLKRNIPWASTYGNHDSQFNLSREELYLEESKYDSSYTRHSLPGVSGVTNYYLLIHPLERGGSPVAILWFFDSQGGFPFLCLEDSASVPNWVESSTVSWFLSSHKDLQNKWGNIPSLAFVHIPPSPFLTVQKNLLPKPHDKSTYFPGLNDDVPLDAQGDGWQDVPFLQALVDTPNLHSIYSGHDHGNSWCANWPAIKDIIEGMSKPHVCFCKHTGYGGYGRWNRGSRNLRLIFKSGQMEVESWVRMENGNVVQHVSLNSTYGIDKYPADDGEKDWFLQ